jgi:hypothetical protein
MASPADIPAARTAQRVTDLTAELNAVRLTLNKVREAAFGGLDQAEAFAVIRRTLGDNWEHTQVPGRMFDLMRDRDFSGKSGTGRVAEGFVFEDGTVVMRWLSNRASTNIYASVEDVIEVHGHGGATQVVFR